LKYHANEHLSYAWYRTQSLLNWNGQNKRDIDQNQGWITTSKEQSREYAWPHSIQRQAILSLNLNDEKICKQE